MLRNNYSGVLQNFSGGKIFEEVKNFQDDRSEGKHGAGAKLRNLQLTRREASAAQGARFPVHYALTFLCVSRRTKQLPALNATEGSPGVVNS
ncbi:MAG: hypothetical protein AUI63_02475 [Gemmatimonadetes bacterium 13_1_40CM_2_60_3]|nr:MAG: hypothetical protein AUI63_02475 [Gemmatimonadetes bacterium 13_1_40CM_2_60_3]